MSKKPDSIVWSEEKGYFSKELKYGSNLSAPVIKLEDVRGWRQREVINVNHQLLTKYEELKKDAEKLMDDYHWNDLIYHYTEYNFIPVIGHIYYLYERDNGTFFLSMVEPNQWKKKHIGTFKLDSSNKWIKL